MAPYLVKHPELVILRSADLSAATNHSDALTAYISDVLLSVHSAVYMGQTNPMSDQFAAVRLMRLGRRTASVEDTRIRC